MHLLPVSGGSGLSQRPALQQTNPSSAPTCNPSYPNRTRPVAAVSAVQGAWGPHKGSDQEGQVRLDPHRQKAVAVVPPEPAVTYWTDSTVWEVPVSGRAAGKRQLGSVYEPWMQRTACGSPKQQCAQDDVHFNSSCPG